MDDSNSIKLVELGRLTRDQVGASEENVKQKIIVPLLEAYGHHRNDLDFEHGSRGKRIDIFIKGLQSDSKVIIDAKGYEENLEDHIEQIETYAFQESPLLTLIISGKEIRIYSAIRGYSFRDSLLHSLRRESLETREAQEILEKYLGRKNLVSRETRKHVHAREDDIVNLRMKVERLEGQFLSYRAELEQQATTLLEQKEKLEQDLNSLRIKLSGIDKEKAEEIAKLYHEVDLPTPPSLSEAELVSVLATPEEYVDAGASFIGNGEAVEITIPSTPKSSWKEYNLIQIGKKIRSFFPGYHVWFVLESDIGPIETRVVGGSAQEDDPDGGTYISYGLTRWYREHKDLRPGNRFMITKLGERRYKLEIRKD